MATSKHYDVCENHRYLFENYSATGSGVIASLRCPECHSETYSTDIDLYGSRAELSKFYEEHPECKPKGEAV